MNLLRIDASARINDSVTRSLTDKLIAGLHQQHSDLTITQRELSDGLPLLNEDWINASFTASAERTQAQQDALALSGTLIEELKAADAIVVAVPMYNFGVPAVLKAWVDLIARPQETFRYSENGPVGLLEDRPVYLVMASGGTPVSSDIDFASGFMRHIFRFIGITDVHVIAADRMMIDADASLSSANDQMDAALNPRAAA